jgi:hypothetical protein
MPDYFYFSCQYSAIQKAVLRHDRLWSMAGISQILAQLNEIELPRIAKKYRGLVMVAGGGKFMARFATETDAKKAKEEIEQTIATTVPMLETQYSSVRQAGDFKKAKAPLSPLYPGILHELDEQKRCFRGYGVSYNPHFQVCAECGEYPSVQGNTIASKAVCDVCQAAYNAARIDLADLVSKQDANLTSLEQIYQQYLRQIKRGRAEIRLNLEELCQVPDSKPDDYQRMAVWLSDLNNMGDKVSLWLEQPEEQILETFRKVSEINVKIIAQALACTFPKLDSGYLPFRLIIASGDDLCVVMREDKILQFALDYATQISKEVGSLPHGHPLSQQWLEEENKKRAEEKQSKGVKPYCFGSAFIVASHHTPFRKVHELGETLMKEAKEKTNRAGNSINWRVLAADCDPVSESLLTFDKCLLIDKAGEADTLSFREYCDRRDFYAHLSGSHLQQLVELLIRYPDGGDRVERQLQIQAAAELQKSYQYMLVDPRLRHHGTFACARVATLLELMSIGSEQQHDEEGSANDSE